MIEGLAAVLVPALAVALSPVPVYAVMLMLDVPRGRSMAAIFLAGWMGGLSLVAYVVLVVIDSVVPDPPDASLGWLSVVLSVLMVVLAVRQWRGRSSEGPSSVAPRWTDEIATFTARRTLGVAVPLAAVSPRVFVLTVAAMVAAVTSATSATSATSGGSPGSTSGTESAALVWFIAIGSVGVAAPLVIAVVGGRRAARWLDATRRWVAANHDAIVIATMLLAAGSELSSGLVLLV